MSTTITHTFRGWKKIRSRSGGLASAKCSCGWLGRPELGTALEHGQSREFAAHLSDTTPAT